MKSRQIGSYAGYTQGKETDCCCCNLDALQRQPDTPAWTAFTLTERLQSCLVQGDISASEN
ncbi:hypothetical protein Pla110_32120 [Polystyrenella longa]|uniref:Uncharacterized protein n=1 Tax=Polystyrenella longa TaxID=2528007 RepID=A0A518CQI9_9PLAN|nr:hypothetical protein Pla110_32120 [Polystyrenella longa]